MEKAPEFATPLSVFISCASTNEDEVLLQKFEKHLALLKKQGIIMPWHHRKTLVGMNKQQEHDKHLESASLIILLISADFLVSDDCNREMELALARQEEGVLVIPVLLHPVDLHGAPIESLLCLPRDQRPVALWENKDAAFTTIVAEIRTTIEEYLSPQQNKPLSEKEKRLRALIPDHNGFLKDRLESFVGRQQELVEVQEKINQRLQTGGYVTITGHAGQGKSSIIAKLIEIYGVEQVAYHFIPINPGPDHQVGLLRNLMARLILKYKLSDLYVASDNRAALRDYFPKVLTEVANQGGQEIIFVDGLDQLEEDFNGVRDLSFLPMNPPVGIVFVLGTRPNDTMKPLELLKPHDEYRLPNLSRQDFDRILQHRHVSLKQTVADQFYKIMGENALYLDLVAKELIAYDVIDHLSIITRVTANPANIFSLSLERLKRQGQLWERVIYPVLGILLTAQEPLSLLCMKDLLQVEDYKLRDGIAKLGGLITEDTQRRYSLFHLKLRDYLHQDAGNPQKEYVFSVEEEEGWHARLAEWCERGGISQIWQDIGDLKEQGRRKYARQHYITHLYYARKWQQLFEVLDEGSYGQAKIQYDPSMYQYVQDLYRGCQSVTRSGTTMEEMIMMLPHLWRYTLLRGSLSSRANQYPQETFRLLLLLDRENEALGLVELLTDPFYKVEILLLIANYLAKQQGLETESTQLFFRASEVAYTIEKSFQRAEALSKIANSLAEAGQWTRAEAIARVIDESYQLAKALSRLGSSLAKVEQWEQAKRIWTDVETIAHTLNDNYWQTEILNEIASSLANVEQWEQAEQIWTDAETIAHTLEKNAQRAIALSHLANSLAKAEKWERAEQIWSHAETIARALEESLLKTASLREIANSLSQVNQWQQANNLWTDAEEIARTIEGNDERAMALSQLASLLAKAEQWDKAEILAYTIEKSPQKAMALSQLASLLAKAEQWERAESIIYTISRTIEESHWQDIALKEFAGALARTKQWERSEATARMIKEKEQRAIALSELACSLAENQYKERAKSIYTEIEKIIRLPDAFPLSVVVFRELVSSLVQAKNWEQAEAIAYAIEEGYQRANALSELASSLAQAEQWKQAERLWGVAEVVAHGIKEDYYGGPSIYWQGIALNGLVSSLAQAKQWKQAEAIAHTIKKNYQQAEALSELVSSLAHAEQWKQAEKIAYTIEESHLRAQALRNLASSLAHAGQWEQAKRFWAEVEGIARMMEKSHQHSETLRELACSLAHAEQWEQAERIVCTIEEKGQRAGALSELASLLAQAKQWERAERMARTIEEKGQRAMALSELASSLAQAKQREQAERLWIEVEMIACTIEEDHLRLKSLRELVSSFAHAEQWESAERIAHMMKGSYEKVEALSILTNCLFNIHEYQRLLHVIHFSWLEVETKNEAFLSFSLALSFISFKPEIGDAFYRGIQWVDAFLKG